MHRVLHLELDLAVQDVEGIHLVVVVVLGRAVARPVVGELKEADLRQYRPYNSDPVAFLDPLP